MTVKTARQTAEQFVNEVEDAVRTAASFRGIEFTARVKVSLAGRKSIRTRTLYLTDLATLRLSYSVERGTGKSALIGLDLIDETGEVVGTWSTWKAVKRHALETVGGELVLA